MIRLSQLRRGLDYGALGVLVLAHIVTFTVWQAYISGRTGPIDYALPAVMLLLVWLVGALLVRHRALLWLWLGLVAVLTAGNGVLYQYYHSMHVPLTASDLVPMLQLTWAQPLSAQLHFLLRGTNLAICGAIVMVVGSAIILLTTLLRPHSHKSNSN